MGREIKDGGQTTSHLRCTRIGVSPQRTMGKTWWTPVSVLARNAAEDSIAVLQVLYHVYRDLSCTCCSAITGIIDSYLPMLSKVARLILLAWAFFLVLSDDTAPPGAELDPYL